MSGYYPAAALPLFERPAEEEPAVPAERPGALDFTMPRGMDPACEEVWHVIRFREGSSRAIQVKELAALLNMGERNVQRCVRKLVNLYGRPVGTSNSEPFGYYHATTPAERSRVAARHRKRALKIMATAAALEGISKAELLRRYQTEIEAA